jgi:hypothetical protein
MSVPLLPVDSSMMSHVGYDPATQTLTVLFGSGKLYEYSGVEPEVYEALMASSSKGSFMRNEIFDCYPDRLVKGRGRR